MDLSTTRWQVLSVVTNAGLRWLLGSFSLTWTVREVKKFNMSSASLAFSSNSMLIDWGSQGVNIQVLDRRNGLTWKGYVDALKMSENPQAAPRVDLAPCTLILSPVQYKTQRPSVLFSHWYTHPWALIGLRSICRSLPVREWPQNSRQKVEKMEHWLSGTLHRYLQDSWFWFSVRVRRVSKRWGRKMFIYDSIGAA